MTYETPRQYAVLNLAKGEYLKNASCTFFYSSHETSKAFLYAKSLSYMGENEEFDETIVELLLKALIEPLTESDNSWKQIAESNYLNTQDESGSSIVALDELSGPATFIFVTQQVRLSIHGVIGTRIWDDSSNILDDSANIFDGQMLEDVEE